ncbi:MAG: tripartite tricarboxylate transporter TctB family protein [Mesorhizobium sp.]|uniref:tripartite tricarboxylate transporter TctB family protein n=1 Tax=Mesorhizobium sp. TaxID=1871066 RepID=UPI000FE9025D|nr:tripartite tricarboxylate transporter TctB family protein [Mesorhizobium sp.]RWI50507.1 MAG: tripartite tricarboxylate transporter TctB family protein [Mesorhizobium sp.]
MNFVRNDPDLAAGLLFGALGILGVLLSLGYPIGSAARMGPGFVPLVFSTGLTLMAAIILATAVLALRKSGEGKMRPSWSPRPLCSVMAGIVGFGLLIAPAGLVVASAVLMSCSGLAAAGIDHKKHAIISVALIAATALVFVYAIGVRIDILPAGGRLG